MASKGQVTPILIRGTMGPTHKQELPLQPRKQGAQPCLWVALGTVAWSPSQLDTSVYKITPHPPHPPCTRFSLFVCKQGH